MNAVSRVVALRGDLIRFLQAGGHDVTVVSAADSTTDALRNLGVSFVPWPVSRQGINLFAESHSLVRLRAILARLRPRIILCFTQKAILYGSIAARTLPRCTVFSVFAGLGFLFSDESYLLQTLSPVIRTVLRRALRRNPIVFFQNRDDLDLFVSHHIIPRNRSCRLYGSGVDTGYFSPIASPKSSPTTVFLMISRLISQKGVLDYIKAASLLKNAGCDARMMLLGPYDDHPTAVDPATIQSSEESGFIEYLGSTTDVRPYLAAADVFVLPSYYREGTPRSALEAMAMAKPIITTDSPGCRETVIDSENGLLVPVRQPEVLANAMKTFVGNQRLVHMMGQRSRSLALDLYDVRKVNQHLWSTIAHAIS